MLTTKEICRQFADRLQLQRQQVSDILITIETYTTIEDELKRSVNCLENIEIQEKYINGVCLESVCAYLPMNQPLYSFILDVFLLKLVSIKVFYRPPEMQRELHRKLYDLFQDLFQEIYICGDSRAKFFDEHVHNSDVVVFTGKYENARKLMRKLNPKTLMIYNGSALNPIVVTPTANIPQSVSGTIKARLYNSGQDCMAPAGILLHKSIAYTYIEELIKELKTLHVGRNSEHDVTVGPMMSKKCVVENMAFLQAHSDAVIYGKKKSEGNLIYPTIFRFNQFHIDLQKIMYVPFFLLIEYETIEDIETYLRTSMALLYKGYISVFGLVSEANSIMRLGLDLIILRNSTLFDCEDGNKEFGGYGEGCSFVSYNNKIVPKPILLLKEIQEWYLSIK